MIKFSRGWLIVAALLAGLLVAAACGGGGDDGDDGDDGPTPTESMADGEPTEPADGDANGDTDGDALSGLRNAASRFGQQEMKVTYLMETNASGEVETGTFAFAWRDAANWRIDFEFEGEMGSIITSDEATYICFQEGGSGQCLQSPVSEMPFPFLNYFTDPDTLGDLVSDVGDVDVSTSSTTIAGVDGTCYEVSGTAEGEDVQGQFCFSDDGLLLLLDARSTGEDADVRMEATEVSDSVSDEDLEPPYPVQNLEDLIPEGIDIPDDITAP